MPSTMMATLRAPDDDEGSEASMSSVTDVSAMSTVKFPSTVRWPEEAVTEGGSSGSDRRVERISMQALDGLL